MTTPPPRRPTLGVLDISNGPSGLSSYLALLWPALTSEFRVVVFGDPMGPYAQIPDTTFVAIPHALRHVLVGKEVGTRPGTPPGHAGGGADRPAGSGGAWHRLSPASLKWSAGFLQSAFVLAGVLRRHRLDLVYAPICDAESAVFAARIAGVRRVVGTFHMPPPATRSTAHRLAMRLTARLLRAGIAVSEEVARGWGGVTAARHSNIVVIKNGVHVPPTPTPQSARDETLRGFGISPDKRPVFAAVGRLAPQKGFGYLLEAVARVKKTHPTLTIIVAGSGLQHDELCAAKIALGVEENVHFVGQLSDITPLLQACDAFVLSSTSEAMPFSLLEAMSHGLPVVATSVGGVPELVRHGETGILCPPADAAALATGLETLLRDPGLRARLGAAGRAVVLDRFDARDMVRKSIEVYRGSLSR